MKNGVNDLNISDLKVNDLKVDDVKVTEMMTYWISQVMLFFQESFQSLQLRINPILAKGGGLKSCSQKFTTSIKQ